MKKFISSAFFLALSVSSGFAEGTFPQAYLGTVPFALGNFSGNMIVNGLCGMVSNGEAAVALHGGLVFAPGHVTESRLSTGPVNQIVWETQLHAGYLFFPFEAYSGWSGGPFGGIFIRNHLLTNRLTGTSLILHVPELTLGWRWDLGDWMIGLSADWNVCGVTWSPVSRSGAAFDWIQVPFGFCLTPSVAVRL